MYEVKRGEQGRPHLKIGDEWVQLNESNVINPNYVRDISDFMSSSPVNIMMKLVYGDGITQEYIDAVINEFIHGDMELISSNEFGDLVLSGSIKCICPDRTTVDDLPESTVINGDYQVDVIPGGCYTVPDVINAYLGVLSVWDDEPTDTPIMIPLKAMDIIRLYCQESLTIQIDPYGSIYVEMIR